MSSEILKILLIEDNPHDAILLESALEDSSVTFEITHVETLKEGLRWLHGQRFDCILLDLGLPDGFGLENIARVTSLSKETPIVILTGLKDEETLIRAVQQGAQDYLVKGEFSGSRMERTIRHAIERKRTTEALRLSEERFALVARGTHDGIFDWDLATDQVYLSPRWYEMLGLRNSGSLESSDKFFERVHASEVDKLRATFENDAHSNSDIGTAEFRIHHQDGSYRWVNCRWATQRDDGGLATRFVGSQTDITSTKTRDPLTKLPNRTLLEDRIGRSMSRLKTDSNFRCVTMLIGIDQFDVVIGGMGHDFADALVQGVAAIFKSILRPTDTLARIDTTKFVIQLDEMKGQHEAIHAVSRFLNALKNPISVLGRQITVSASAGLVACPPSYPKASQILRDAEAALNQAQDKGPGSFAFFDPTMQKELQSRIDLESDLKRSIERKQIFLHYQPVVSLDNACAIGVEALVRWNHPDRGLVGPFQFIPLAEETGFILPLGEHIIHSACDQLARWNKAGVVDIDVNVNLSAAQLMAPGLLAVIDEAVREHGVSYKNLQFELTESTLIDHSEQVHDQLIELRDRNSRIALDDFGTGYSSLSYLHKLPFDCIKVDRSFVMQLERESVDGRIVESILALAKSLELSVVAEGIETKQQMELLKDMGCPKGQGYLFARPNSATDVSAMLQGKPLI